MAATTENSRRGRELTASALAARARADGVGTGGEGVDDVVRKSHTSYGGAWDRVSVERVRSVQNPVQDGVPPLARPRRPASSSIARRPRALPSGRCVQLCHTLLPGRRGRQRQAPHRPRPHALPDRCRTAPRACDRASVTATSTRASFRRASACRPPSRAGAPPTGKSSIIELFTLRRAQQRVRTSVPSRVRG